MAVECVMADSAGQGRVAQLARDAGVGERAPLILGVDLNGSQLDGLRHALHRADLDADIICLASRRVHPGSPATGEGLALAANLQWGARAINAASHLQAVDEPMFCGRGRYVQVMAVEI